MLSTQLFFVLKEQKGLRYCIRPLYRHSWLGPGIWCSWTAGCVLNYSRHCAVIWIRSLVPARDDAVGGSVLLLCGCIPYSSVHQECGARHCKYFAWWTGGCEGGSLLMHAQTNEHHLHSYVLLFLCLLIYRFVLSLALCCRWDEIPGPRQGWRCRWHCAVVLWMYTF